MLGDKNQGCAAYSPANKGSRNMVRTLSNLGPQPSGKIVNYGERLSHTYRTRDQNVKVGSAECRSVESPKASLVTQPMHGRQDIQHKIQEATKRAQADFARIKDLTIRCNELQQDNVRLSAALRQIEHEHGVRTSITTLEDRLRKASESYSEVSQTVQQLQAALRKSEEERESLRSYIETEEEKMLGFQDYLDKTTEDNQRLMDLTENLKKDVEHLQQQLAKREACQMQTLKELERYSEKLKAKEIEYQALKNSTGRSSISSPPREDRDLTEDRITSPLTQKLMQQIESLNETILRKSKQLIELKTQMVQPDILSLELKGCKMQLAHYEQMLSKSNQQIVKLQQTVRKLKAPISPVSSQAQFEIVIPTSQPNLGEHSEEVTQEFHKSKREVNKLKQQIFRLEQDLSDKTKELQTITYEIDRIREQSRENQTNWKKKITVLEEKVADWERKFQKTEQLNRETVVAIERERSSTKIGEQDKNERLKCVEGQLKDCMGLLASQRRDFLRARKDYEERIQIMETQRLSMERKIDQLNYDIELRDSEVNRIANVGKTLADELQFVSNQSQERKQIIEFLQGELAKANSQFVAARQQAEEAKKDHSVQQEIIQDLEERIRQLSSMRHPAKHQPQLRKVVSATSHNFLTMTSQSPPRLSTMAQMTLPDGQQSSPMDQLRQGSRIENLRIVATLPEMSMQSDHAETIELETLRRQNKVMKTVASENQELHAEVVKLQQRLKVVEPPKDTMKQREILRLREQNAFLKKVSSRRLPYESLLQSQRKKIVDYEKQMTDSLQQNLRLKGRCTQFEARLKQYQKELLMIGKPSILQVGIPGISDNKTDYLKTNNAELESRCQQLLKINSQLSVQVERTKQKDSGRSVMQFYKQQAQIAQQKAQSLDGQLKNALEQVKSLQSEVQSCRAEVQRNSARNSELNSTVNVLNLQMGLLQNDRILKQASHEDAFTERPAKRYRLSDEIGRRNDSIPGRRFD